MTSSSSSGDACRRPWLAAYADGQLPEPQRQRVERWLACHPQDWSVVEQERALTDTIQQWWAATAPSPPTAAQWQELAQRIQDACALTHRPQRMAQQSRRTSVRMVRRALIAASVLLIISLGWLQPWRENQVPGPAAEPALAQQTETLDPAGLALTPSAT
ncbi:MAG: hypothetical protein NZ703_08850, partial [Gemmataceae bacterium]|nr:hypothetical protein [Gemmataceae bacterium]